MIVDLAAWRDAHPEKSKTLRVTTHPEFSESFDLADPFAIIPRTWARIPLSANEFRVGIAVLSFAGDRGCFARLDTIAEACGLSKRTVQRYLAKLVERGLLVAQTRYGKPTLYFDPGHAPRKSRDFDHPAWSRPSTTVTRHPGQPHAQTASQTKSLIEKYQKHKERQEPTETGDAAIAALKKKMRWTA